MTVVDPVRLGDEPGHPGDGDREAAARDGREAPAPSVHAPSGRDAGWSSEAAPTTSPARLATPPTRAVSSPAPASATHARTLFRIPFRSAMSDEDAQRLHDDLDMALHLHPKHPAVRPPLGVTPLPFGGLFLVRGEGEEQWALECRSWGDPPSDMVRACRLEAMFAARRLDPSVPLPTRRAPAPPEPAPARRRGRRRGFARRRGGPLGVAR